MGPAAFPAEGFALVCPDKDREETLSGAFFPAERSWRN